MTTLVRKVPVQTLAATGEGGGGQPYVRDGLKCFEISISKSLKARAI